MTMLTLGILMLHAAVAPTEDVVAQFDEVVFKVPDAEPPREIRYRLLKPLSVEPGRHYPVVLFLHGAGERGDDNRLQLMYLPDWMAQKEWREKYPCYLVAPQCPKARWWAGARRPTEADKDAIATSEAEIALTAVQALASTLPIDQKRIYLTGLSMGGYGSWTLAAAHPDVFAAVVPICGGGDKAWAAQLKNVPIWAVHGDADNVVPPDKTREMIAAIKAAGGTPQYTELKGVGHNSWTAAYNDPHGVLEWMFQQHK